MVDMEWLDEIIKELEREKDVLVRSWEKAKLARDNAPSAMESHSDTTRSEKEKLVSALEEDIARVERDLKKVGVAITKTEGGVGEWSYVELKQSELTIKIVVVSEGMGGKKVGEMQLVSTGSPLGQKLLGKNMGEEIEFLGRNMVVSVVRLGK